MGSAATVFKSIESLLEKEIIYKEQEQDGRAYYEVYDVLFER